MSAFSSGSSILIKFQDAAIFIALACALWGVSIYDLTTSKKPPPPVPVGPAEESEPPAPPPPEIVPPQETIDPVPRIQVVFDARSDLGRMGVLTTSGDPENTSDDNLRMTYARDGNTNNTWVSVDGETALYGSSSGTGRMTHRETAKGKYESEWKYRDIRFSQTVEIVPGDVSRRLDTLRITFAAKNEGTSDHLVGSRFMIDTLIGGNDGVPFIVAGEQRLVTDAVTFGSSKVPDFVRALQNASLTNPGVIVDIGLNASDLDRPDEVTLTHWPGGDALWLYDRTRSLGGDSAAGFYFNPTTLPPSQMRSMGFTYGLGSISSTKSKNSRLSLTAGGPFHAAGSFWLVALVQEPQSGTALEIKLPPGLKLSAGHSASKSVSGNEKFSQTSWLVVSEPSSIGDHEIRVNLTPGDLEERQIIKIQPPLAKLTVRSPDKATAGKAFWVSALIRNPKQGQTVELILPKGLSFTADHAAQKSVAEKQDYVQVNWLVKSHARAMGVHRLLVNLTPDGSSADCAVALQVGNIID